MADDIVVFANTVAEWGKDPSAKGGDDQVDGKEDGRHLVDFFLYLYLSQNKCKKDGGHLVDLFVLLYLSHNFFWKRHNYENRRHLSQAWPKEHKEEDLEEHFSKKQKLVNHPY